MWYETELVSKSVHICQLFPFSHLVNLPIRGEISLTEQVSTEPDITGSPKKKRKKIKAEH
jgi:hypothetical protein